MQGSRRDFGVRLRAGRAGRAHHGGGEYGGGEPEIWVSAEEADSETVRPDKLAITLEQLRPYYQGLYFATISTQKKLAADGHEGGSFAEKIDGYQKMVEDYNAAIQETAEAHEG